MTGQRSRQAPQHLWALMMIHNASDVELCRLFPSSLWDSALSWLALLAPRSILGFRELGQKFRQHFAEKWEIIQASDYLFTIRQQQQETVQDYTERFNKEAMKVSNLSDRDHIQAYKHGYISLSLTKVFAIQKLQSVDDLLDVIHEFIRGEKLVFKASETTWKTV